MPYIGNTPADKFLTLAKQNFSTSATTSYTLDSAVSSTQDIALFINNVRQSPVDAYSVSGTALTLTSATAGTDEMYCVYLGKTVGTVNPPNDSVGLDQLSATGTASSSTYLRGDNSWATAGGDLSFGGDTFGADKTVGANDAYAFSLETSGNTAIKMDANGHVTMPLQSCFSAYNNLAQSNVTGDDTMYTVLFDTERFDLNGDFASNTFTAPVTGKYLLSAHIGLTGYTSSSTYSNMYLVTSNDTYSAFAGTQVENNFFFSSSVVADMDASDTAIVKVNAGGEGSKVVDVASGGDGLCFFSGCLLA